MHREICHRGRDDVQDIVWDNFSSLRHRLSKHFQEVCQLFYHLDSYCLFSLLCLLNHHALEAHIVKHEFVLQDDRSL